MSDSDYGKAWSALSSAAGGSFIGDHLDELTIDQRLKAAEVMALLSIAQELSQIHHNGINPDFQRSE